MFVIEDEEHAEPGGEFATLEAALHELQRRASLPWDQPPNQAPCVGWKTCGRTYEIVEYDASITPWTEVRRLPSLRISAAGASWLEGGRR